MSVIGDLIFLFRGDGTKLEVDAKTSGGKAGDTAAGSFAASFKKSFSGANLGKGLVQGLGLAGALGGVNLVANAVGTLTDVLQDSVKAAREDQASQAALGSSLRANVKDWDGNTNAIEKVIASRMRLGFTDEEQRASLARLLPVYRDVNKALEVQRAAMDLARFKKISLADATVQLITIEGGQYRGLKQLIGSTKDITNSTEALTAVRQAAGDAAEDLAATDEGKLLASQIKQGEALEKLGYVLLPAFTAATVAAGDVAQDLAGNLDGITKAADAAEPILKALGISTGEASQGGFDLIHSVQDLLAVANPTKISNTLGVLLDTVDKTGLSTAATRQQLRDLGLDVSEIASDLGGKAADDLFDFKDAVDEVGSSADLAGSAVAGINAGAIASAVSKAARIVSDAAVRMAGKVKTSHDAVVKSWDDMKKDVVDDAAALIDQAYDPIITADRLAGTQRELAAERIILASKKSSKAEKRDAADRIHELTKDNAQYVLDLAKTGDTSSKAYAKGLKELKSEIAKAKGPAKAALQEVLDKIHEIERDGKVVPINLRISSKTTSGLGPGGHAAGGYRAPGIASWVGEKGPELSVPTTGSFIIPTAQSMALAGVAAGAGGGDVNLTLYGRPLEVQSPADVVREMRRAQRLGLPPRRRQPGWKT